MRAPKNEATGSSGQSIVKAQFERLGWGVAANTEHDLGTDLWLMARDARRFDVRALVGAQVKSGPSWFEEPEIVDSEIVGWWFRESDDSHFVYWTEHSVPHIVVLNRPEDDRSFWVHVTPSKVESTGKGRKILVPSDATVDSEHLDDLLEVAMSRASLPEWQGSAWEPGQDIPEPSRLRYALMTPRLVAPHPNNTPTAVSPEQALALLVQMRIRDLDRWKEVEPRLDASVAAASGDWKWLFYSALRRCLLDGDTTGLVAALDSGPDPQARAAAAASVAAIRFEEERVQEALEAIERTLDPDDANPVDHAWLQMHRARCLIELGRVNEARGEALKSSRVGQVAPADPTASMLTGAAAELVFSLSNWDGESLALAVQGRDNVGSWWRSQTLVSGLSKQFEEDFNSWANDSSVTWGAEDTAWLKLRSAMLLSGYSADTPSWRYAGSLLARRQLISAEGDQAIVMALDLLRSAGAHKVIGLAAGRLLEVGPVQPLSEVVSALDLTASTRTSLHANIKLVQRAADVLTEEAADLHARWAMDTLRDLPAFESRFRPTFLVQDALIGLLRAVTVAVSEAVDGEIREHIVNLPPVSDQLAAGRYARLLNALADGCWTPEQVEHLSCRPEGDHSDLVVAIDGLRASRSPEFRESLTDRIAEGDLDALQSYGVVTDLPVTAVTGMIAKLCERVAERVTAARSGAYGIGGPDVMRTLVLLNAWHPRNADWAVCLTAISDPAVIVEHTAGAIDLVGRLARQIPPEVALSLKAPLQDIAERVRPADRFPLFGSRADARGAAALALAQLFPDEVSDTSLRGLLRGDVHQRAAAVRILVATRKQESLTLLTAISKDSDANVRAAVAGGLATWMVDGIATAEVNEVLDDLLSEPGIRLGVAVSDELDEESVHSGLLPLLDRLDQHASAIVRYRSGRARAQLAESSA